MIQLTRLTIVSVDIISDKFVIIIILAAALILVVITTKITITITTRAIITTTITINNYPHKHLKPTTVIITIAIFIVIT